VSLIFLNPTVLFLNEIEKNNNDPWFDNLESEIEIHKEQPVFDGQYSNQCYGHCGNLFQFKKMKQTHNTLLFLGGNIIMHLPMLFKEDEC
jgi:hydroxymethylglutaryl-CoA synthase